MIGHAVVQLLICRSPPRGAWIEIISPRAARSSRRVASPRGERGLKSDEEDHSGQKRRRSPRGERGLKILIIVDIEIVGQWRPKEDVA